MAAYDEWIKERDAIYRAMIRAKLTELRKASPHYSMDCNDEIKALIAERLEKGRKQYGHGLIPNSGYDWLNEALEESLDLAIYLSAKIIEVKKILSQNAH
jgi:hypothetical protein